MVLYFKVHPHLAKPCQAHKVFRHTLAHQLVQPLPDASASSEIKTPGPGRSVSDNLRLKEKHFPETSEVRCVVCAYQKSPAKCCSQRNKDSELLCQV